MSDGDYIEGSEGGRRIENQFSDTVTGLESVFEGYYRATCWKL